MKLTEYEDLLQKGFHLVIIDSIVHDVTDFISVHPGGPKRRLSSIGKDATDIFNGVVYNHSNAARNLLSSMRLAVISS